MQEAEGDNNEKKALQQLNNGGLTRESASVISSYIGQSVSSETIKRIEVGSQIKPRAILLNSILRAYGLKDEEILILLDSISNNNIGISNPHLFSKNNIIIAQSEFGPQIKNAFPIRQFTSTCLEARKADSGGFRENEILITLDDDEVLPPQEFVRLASIASKQNAERRDAGANDVWTDNPSVALYGITDTPGKDNDERLSIRLHTKESWYRYNFIAKQEAAASMRWEALQDLEFPPTPVCHLASGIGISINVICNNGSHIVVGKRSNSETFRKGEYDIAVVEGIRPTADNFNGLIDIRSVARRALFEELGIGRDPDTSKMIDKESRRLTRNLTVFEFGVDLEYYQWNFLSYVNLDFTFEDIRKMWYRAKDRKENAELDIIPNTRESIEEFCLSQKIWSAGAACALRSFDYK